MNMGRVRPFVDEDISQVAELHRIIFGMSDKWSPELYRGYFHEVFLNNPWHDKSSCSLVYEQGDGKIGGFLGVMPRPMWIKGRLIRAAVCSQFIVEPKSRFELAGVHLLKAFLSGPQDLSLADEANDASRALWEMLGGSTALLYSIHWTCILRPAQYVRLRLSRRNLMGPVASLLNPFCQLIDSVATRVPHNPFYRAGPRCVGEDSGVEALLKCSDTFRRPRSLWPEYDRNSLEWLLQRAAEPNGNGNFQKVAVRSATRGLIGWFLYYLDHRGMGEVLQIGSKKTSAHEVLDYLFHHAWRNGAVALRGRLDHGLMPELLSRRGLSHHRRYWTLVHSRKPDLLDAIHRGDAFLTRLEGEWCMRFQKGISD